MSSLIYGVVSNRIFYSNRMELRLRKYSENGIYSMDMDADDFQETLMPANIDDACKFFRKASKIKVVRGISFHDGIIPENPISFDQVPLKVKDPTYDEFEEVEVALVRNKICYFLRIMYTDKSYALMDLKEALESKKPMPIDKLKNITPEMRIVYAFHLLERKKKELLEPLAMVKELMKDSGAQIFGVKKVPRGYEISWKMEKWNLNTLVDNNYKVLEAGFCVSAYDKTQSATSVGLLCKDYLKQHKYLVVTRDASRSGNYGHGRIRGMFEDGEDEYDEYDE